jgi:TM2 domain-containing membrane protein YozV
MDNSNVVSTLIMLFSCGVLIAAIVLAVFLVKRSGDQAKQSEANVNMMMSHIPQDKQMMFMMQYNNSKKNPTTAVLLALFLGGLGAHKFYMGQTGMGILYLLFCWTYIPSIIALIEAFTMAGSVSKYNEEKAQQAVMLLGGLR